MSYELPEISRITKKYYHPVMFADESIAWQANDGLLYLFETGIAEILDKHYPKNSDGWFFNSTKDRYCAENDWDTITVNPSIVATHFGMPVLFEEAI